MGRVLTNNTSLAYAIETALGSLAEAVRSVGTLTFTGNAIATEIVTINGRVYTYEAVPAAADDIDVGVDTDTSINNLVAAINGGSGSGSAYFATTVNDDVKAHRGIGLTIIFTSLVGGVAGDALTTTTDLTNATFGAATLENGLNASAFSAGTLTLSGQPLDTETVTIAGRVYTFLTVFVDAADNILIGATASESLDNLVAALNAATGGGTIYGTATVVNPDVSAARSLAGLAVVLTAKLSGTAGDAVTTVEGLTNGAFNNATLVGGAGTPGANQEWKLTEPNAINGFGASITTVPRNPISNRRQRRKGSVTDLDSTVEFEADITHDSFEDFIEGWVFAGAVNADTVFRGANIVDGAYQVEDPFTAVQGAKFISAGGVITLLEARGYVDSANNGLAPLSVDPATGDTALTVAALADEAAASNAVVKFAGLRTDDCTWDFTLASKTAVLTSAGDISDWTVFGLTPGQVCHIGSPDAAGSVVNAFGASQEIFGYARIKSISGASITFDKLDAALQFDDLTVQVVDLMFGRFFRNVPVNASDFIERSFQFEAAWSNLQDPGPGDEYEYARGNFCNELAFSLPLTDKATQTFGFIGTDTDVPTAIRQLGAATPRDPSGTGAFNTSADIARLRITEVDEDGLTTDFKSLTMTLNNNVSPEKVLGTLGAKFLNTGNFEVDIEAQLLFTSSAVVRAIRNNETVTMDFIITNDDGAIAVDIPAMTMSGGDKELPVNESVLINTTEQAFEDPTLGTSIGISELPVVP